MAGVSVSGSRSSFMFWGRSSGAAVPDPSVPSPSAGNPSASARAARSRAEREERRQESAMGAMFAAATIGPAVIQTTTSASQMGLDALHADLQAKAKEGQMYVDYVSVR